MNSHVYNSTDPNEDESHQVISSYFLGPKAENYEFFKKNIIEILDAQRDARLDYFPRDGKFVTEGVQASTAFRQSTRKMTNAVRQAAHLLGKHSIPFWSPRYQGHMCMDLSMPALLGYFMTMLYNPNNVTIEVSPISTVAEMTTGDELCKMFGFNVDPTHTEPVAWGHITCDGTIANLESMWVARNLKFYPFSIRSAMKDKGPLSLIANKFEISTCSGERKLMKDLDTWELMNLKSADILDIPERLYGEHRLSPAYLQSVMQKYGIQSTSKTLLEKEFGINDMRYYLSNTRHYSWPKSGAVLGIGSDNIIGIQVDRGARVDLNDLRGKLQHCLDNKIGVYAVVAIIGSTEEGAVDPLTGILKLRKEFQKKGLSFLVHGDGAWGGYFCTMLPKGYEPGQEIALPSEKGSGEGFVPDSGLRTKTSEDLFMLREADSVTIDPHKAAYIPYPAGALCYRDGRMRYLVTWTSPYLSRGETTDTSIGVFGIEGSKPGASVMSTWFSNACIGLGPDGYGKLLSEVTFTCSRLSAEWAAMSVKDDIFTVVPLNELPSELEEGATKESIEKERQKIRDEILCKTNEQIVNDDEKRPDKDKALRLLRELGSDLNINGFSCNWKHADGRLNDEVEEANYFNMRVIQRLSVDSPEDDPTKIPFFLTSTTFMIHEYGECAQHFKKRLGLYQDDVDLVVMRNVVMSPWPTDGYFISSLIGEFRKVLEDEVQVCRQRNDISPAIHEFLVVGTKQLYAIHFPEFHLERHRHQLIMQVELPPDVKKKYLHAKQVDPHSLFVLKTLENVSIKTLVKEKNSFDAAIYKGRHSKNKPLVEKATVAVETIVKDKSLKGRYRDRDWPMNHVPFYLFGSSDSMSIEHILVKSPNIQLTAEDIQLDFKVDDAALKQGAILLLEGESEIAMQPFQSTEGPHGDSLSTSGFFFLPSKSFSVTVYEDPKKFNEPGPGLLKGIEGWKKLGGGTMTLGSARYVDSHFINKDPYEVVEGTEKFKKWKKVFDSIGKELE